MQSIKKENLIKNLSSMFWLHFLVQWQWNSGSLSAICVAYEKYQTANSQKAEQKTHLNHITGAIYRQRRANLEFTGACTHRSLVISLEFGTESSDKP